MGRQLAGSPLNIKQKSTNTLAGIENSAYICKYKKNEKMRTTNYTDLRNNLKGYFDKVVDDCEPLIVHRGDEESVVSISMEEYNAIKETEYIMRSPRMVDIIKEGEKEIEQGQGKPVYLDNLWK